MFLFQPHKLCLNKLEFRHCECLDFFIYYLGMSDVFYGIIYKFVLFLLEIVMSEEKQMTNSMIPGGWPLGHRIYNCKCKGI